MARKYSMLCLILATTVWGAVAAAQGEPRHALVIGNGAYKNGADALANAVSDAKTIAQALRATGFEVMEGYDLGNAAMSTTINEFMNLARRFEGLAFFFYAGHGWAFNNENFMMPVDAGGDLAESAAADGQAKVANTCISLNELVDRLKISRKNLSMVVFDACRLDPGSRAGDGALRGPVPMNPTGNIVLAFSTEADKPAKDNSGYAGFLAKRILEPGLEINQVFLRAQIDMAEYMRSQGAPQEPLLQLGGSPLLTRKFVKGTSTTTPYPEPPPPPSMRGNLQVAVNAPEATVWVDGREYGLAFPEKALNIENLSSGEVTVKVAAEGYEPQEKRVRIAGGTWAQEAFELIKRVIATPTEILTAGTVRVFEGGEFAWIPPGRFEMGNKLSAGAIVNTYGGEEKFYTDAPRHTVTLTRGFWLATKEVTVREFERFVKDTGYKTDAEKEGTGWALDLDQGKWGEKSGVTWRKPGWDTQSTQPVVLVSWNDATAYCRWLSEKTGETYRLPTEAEWEYACRAGTTTEFWWGDSMAGGEGKLNGADETPLPGGKRSWTYKFPFSDGYFYVSPAASYQANPWGLYDMHGNVWEWCQDWYGEYASGADTDPMGPTSGSRRVFRGGSWSGSPGSCRSAYRNGGAPGGRYDYLGFRLALPAVR